MPNMCTIITSLSILRWHLVAIFDFSKILFWLQCTLGCRADGMCVNVNLMVICVGCKVIVMLTLELCWPHLEQSY